MSVTIEPLFPEQLALKAELDAAKASVDAAQGVYRALKAKCSHAYRNIDESAVCSICGDRNGWWCPDNPTGLCEYEGGREWCSHCGAPDERK